MSRRQSRSPQPPSLSPDNAGRAVASFYEAFGQLAGAALPHAPALDAAVRATRLPRGTPLFVAGEVHRRIHVVLEGFLTLKYDAPEGTCWVKSFVPPGVPFACVSCLDGMPAPFTACAGVDARVATVPFSTLERIADSSAMWQRAARNAFKLYGQRKEKREMELLMLSPEARYLGFLREMPEIARKLKQHEIASYIRVTPVSLSRIRRRLNLTPAGSRTP